jgi:hypothetical protein
MRSLDCGRYALKLWLGVTIAATLPQHATAHLVPGAKYCGSFDSQQTIESEKIDLSRQLPEGYRRFEIVLFHERLLRVFVPASGISPNSPKVQQIVKIWDSVLAAHHKGCAVGVLGVQFYSGDGKPLFETGVMV